MTKPIPCPYCGQIVMCEVPEDRNLTADEQTELSLSICGCAMGLSFRAKKTADSGSKRQY